MNLLSLPVLMAVALALGLSACTDHASTDHAHGHDAHAHAEPDQPEKGPNKGRILRDGGLAVELAIFEDGVPPEYHAYITQEGRPIPLDQVQLTVELARLDGEKNVFRFTPQDGFLRGNGVVTEPHSFDVTVIARYAGAEHRWTYASYEGRVNIGQASADAAGVVTAKAGPRLIRDVLPVYGRITTDPDAVREISARFPGAIKSVNKSVGDSVRAGEVLARVESNDSLQVYTVTAPISGTLSARKANPGEQAGAAPLFTLTDLSRVWAELSVFPRDQARIRIGQPVRLVAVDGERVGSGKILRISPASSEAGGALKVWASLDQNDGGWTPGLYLTAEVLMGGAEVPLAVRTSGLQAFRDHSVVFAKVGETYEVRMLELGRSDGEYVEVLGGLKPGSEYVTENSYLIKADIEKSGASHDH